MSSHSSNTSSLDVILDGAARVARGTVAGLIGGAVASWVMKQYQLVEERPVMQRRLEKLEDEVGIPREEKEPAMSAANIDGEEPTVKVAQSVSRQLFDHELSDNEKILAGPAVHYGYGAAIGALYGGLSELFPVVGIGLGVPYATLVCLGGRSMAVPAFGLSKPPTEIPADSHASALATHFVYGVTLDISRRILRHIV